MKQTGKKDYYSIKPNGKQISSLRKVVVIPRENILISFRILRPFFSLTDDGGKEENRRKRTIQTNVKGTQGCCYSRTIRGTFAAFFFFLHGVKKVLQFLFICPGTRLQ